MHQDKRRGGKARQPGSESGSLVPVISVCVPQGRDVRESANVRKENRVEFEVGVIVRLVRCDCS
eukprot:CAMPEP_0196653858 /NCGR_PEP_ID=MMETSP1086-20130531/3524_1 /TAXON_ID=77921 /ORGANISM="Cyanoptyche  gloeocystis , Strain SAG4.97" /LENGTH=63 /DNA_ID=CAMNT_0041985265 /DNA_START=93 /DNA_END=280 /DNA_ORIENTATION=+